VLRPFPVLVVVAAYSRFITAVMTPRAWAAPRGDPTAGDTGRLHRICRTHARGATIPQGLLDASRRTFSAKSASMSDEASETESHGVLLRRDGIPRDRREL
jgi:hypothetical protein